MPQPTQPSRLRAKPSVQMTIRIPPNVWEKLDAYCAKNGMAANAAVVLALTEFLGKK